MLPETPHNQMRHLSLEESKRILLSKQDSHERRMGAVTVIAYSKHSEEERAEALIHCLQSEKDRDIRLLIIRSLCAVDHPVVRDTLWSLIQDTDLELQRTALLSLARLKDHRVFGRCGTLINHGNRDQRIDAIIALHFLGTERAIAFLEYSWNLLEGRDDKLFLAKILASHGSSLGEALLERELQLAPEVDTAAALARLGNRFGLVQLQEILLTACGEVELQYGIRIAHYFAIDPVNDSHWKQQLIETLRKM